MNTGKDHEFSIPKLFDKWSAYLDRLATLPQEVTIIGELNFHFDDTCDDNVCCFTGKLDAHGLDNT